MNNILARICPFCKNKFVTNNKQKIYCSTKCNAANYQNKIKSQKKTTSEEYFDWKDYNNLIF